MNKETDKHKKRRMFANKIELPLLDIFNSQKKDMTLIRGIYFLWRLEVEGISITELSLQEIKSSATIKYSINDFLERYNEEDPIAIEYREKVKDIFPLMSESEAKNILLKHLENIKGDELLIQAILKLTK